MILGPQPQMTNMQPLGGQPVQGSPYLGMASQQIQPVQGAQNPLQGLNLSALADILNKNQNNGQAASAASVPQPGQGFGPLPPNPNSPQGAPGQSMWNGIMGNAPGPNDMGGSGVNGAVGGAWQGLQSLFGPQSTNAPTNPAAQNQASQSTSSTPPPGALAAAVGGSAGANNPGVQQAILAQALGGAS